MKILNNAWSRFAGWICGLFLASGCSFGVPTELPQPPASLPEITAEDAQADFDLMRSVLEEAHAGLYRYSTKAEMDRTFQVERAKLNQSVRKTELMNVISETLAAIHCGHTSCDPDEETQNALRNARLFPFRVRAERNRLFVLFNDTPDDQTIRPGMEILEINGHNPTEILKRIWATESADGDIETSKAMGISGHFAELYWRLMEPVDKFAVKASDASGKIETVKLAGVTSAERQKNQNSVNAPIRAGLSKINWTNENQSLRFLKDPQIAEIRIRYFVGKDFPHWIESTFKTLHDKETKALIIDLRGNGGGEDMYGALLVSYLTDQPFEYLDHINIKTITPSFKQVSDWGTEIEKDFQESTTRNPAGGYLGTPRLHQGLSKQLAAKYPFLGRVFVIIDGGTFSTAADFCAVTRHLKKATFIGEETGGAYYGNNSGFEPRVKLPNSRLQIRVPMYEYWNAVSGAESKRRGTIPEYVVPTRTAKLLLGVDEQLNLAQELATASVSNK